MHALQNEIRAAGEKIFALMEGETSSVFRKDFWYGQIMDWSMRNEAFKVQMFRFVDVLPCLNSNAELTRHLQEYFRDQGPDLPKILGWGLGLSGLAPGLLAAAIKQNVTEMARMFITGANGAEAVDKLKQLRSQPLAFTVDLLGEAVVSEPEADAYQARYLELIERLAREAAGWPEIELIDRDHLGPIPRVNVSVKITALDSQIDPGAPERALEVLKRRLRPLFRRARERGVFLNLDMESYAVKDLTLALFKSLLEEPEFRDYGDVGLVIQAYLREAERDLDDVIAWARRRPSRVTVRLVKGAYWDYETVLARQRGWPIPVFLEKRETDANFERLTTKLLENDRHVKSAFGTHNVRSIAHALVQAHHRRVDPRSFEIQMLHGMAEPIKAALVRLGLRVREYAPIGEWLPGMAYLVRRLLENTSNEGFLRAKFVARQSTEELLRDPAERLLALNPVAEGDSSPRPDSSGSSGARRGPARPDLSQAPPATKDFQNEPWADFSKAPIRSALRDALEKVRRQLGRTYPLVIGKKEVPTRNHTASVNPARPGEIVGRVARATTMDARAAIESARTAWPAWRNTPPETRAGILEKAAEIMRARRFELAAWEIFEVGKPWREADADVTEAVDFCRFYAEEMRRLGRAVRTAHIPGEECLQHYRPRGVGVVIAPWNFPLAILCGMTSAALVTGNTVIMKPAEPAAVIGYRLMEIFREAGVPPGVLNYLPGPGAEIGAFLVEHPEVAFVAFTGSKEVGLKIFEAAGRTGPGQCQLKHVVCEMGGKNAIIVDRDADLDEVVPGALYSAFGYAGQKCSALSRLIVVEPVYDRTVARLVEAARSLTVDLPERPGTIVGPVINDAAFKRIQGYLELGKHEARLAFQGTAPAEGYFIPPTIFTEVPPQARLAREEIFGPVLAIIKVRDFDEALRVANGVEFALTGGVYSRSPTHLERAKNEFHVGNLYLNRGITGALVGRHPFGGFKLSGGGTKAGGRDYLLHFLYPRVVVENTLRRGFAPQDVEGATSGAER